MQVTIFWCEDCAQRIERYKVDEDGLGDSYHEDPTPDGGVHPVIEKTIEWNCTCHNNPPCHGCVENLWEENL